MTKQNKGEAETSYTILSNKEAALNQRKQNYTWKRYEEHLRKRMENSEGWDHEHDLLHMEAIKE